MSGPDLSLYIEVPERIKDFMSKYPEGSLQCHAVEYRDLPVDSGQLKMHVIYHALAYRTPDDPRPGHGMASEPLPGLTPYTKGSELMNAETSAWGRALAALGFVSKRDGTPGVASANEVRNRPGRTSEGVTASEKQIKFLEKLIKEKKPTVEQLNFMLIEAGASGVTVEAGWTAKLGVGPASGLIEWLKERPLPDLEHPSDVPTGGVPSHGDPGPQDVPFEVNAS